MARADRKKLGLQSVVPEAPSQELQPNEIRAEMYRQAFADGPGAYVLNDLKIGFGDRRSFVPDSNATAFHEGQRDVYRMILALIQEATERDAQAAPQEKKD